MTSDDLQEDPVFPLLGELRTWDVDAARAQRLRRRCHRVLEAQRTSTFRPRNNHARAWPFVHVVAGAWCLLYLLLILRRAVDVYSL